MECVKIESELKKQGNKIMRMFAKTKEGKKVDYDFYIETAHLIAEYKRFKEALMVWGKQIVYLRKSLI
jgi:hypothetical protein